MVGISEFFMHSIFSETPIFRFYFFRMAHVQGCVDVRSVRHPRSVRSVQRTDRALTILFTTPQQLSIDLIILLSYHFTLLFSLSFSAYQHSLVIYDGHCEAMQIVATLQRYKAATILNSFNLVDYPATVQL